MTRLVVAFLFACGLAVAAPVPKAGPKLEDVYGEITDKKCECKFELSKDGALRVTVPTSRPAEDAVPNVLKPPVAGKMVEGDFVLTVRLTQSIPAKAGRATERQDTPEVVAGVGVYAERPKDSSVTYLATVRWVYEDRGLTGMCYTQGACRRVDGSPDDPRYLRVTRKGDDLEYEVSDDGKAWDRFCLQTINHLPAALRVGPVAYQSTDQDVSATFDRYEIKPLAKAEKK